MPAGPPPAMAQVVRTCSTAGGGFVTGPLAFHAVSAVDGWHSNLPASGVGLAHRHDHWNLLSPPVTVPLPMPCPSMPLLIATERAFARSAPVAFGLLKASWHTSKSSG